MAPPGEDIAARLDRLTITSRHLQVFAIVGLGLVVDAIDLAVMNAIAGALVHQGASIEETAPLATATAAGLGAGALLGGVGGDLFGRRPFILAGAFIVAFALLGSALSQTVAELVVWRGLTAFGLGIENVLAYGILVEFLPPAQRGRWLARLAVLGTAAAPLTLLASVYLLPSPNGWRFLLFAVCALSTLTFALRFLLPESARWLVARGRYDAADRVVTRFERAARGPLAPPAAPSEYAPNTSPPWWSAAMLTRLGLAALINVALVCATLGFVAWLPTFFAAEGRTLPAALLNSTVITAGAPVGAIIGMIATDMFERKWSAAVAALIAAAIGLGYASAPPSLALPLGFFTVVAIYAYGAIAVSGYLPELFPTPVRLRAIGLAITAGRLAAVFLPALIIVVFRAGGQAGVLGLIASVLLALAAALAIFGVRTRGRALDAI